MKTVHLYLKPAANGAVVIVTHTFDGGPLPVATRELLAVAARGSWIEALVVNPDVKAVYNCAGTGLTKPQGLGCAWFDLSPGHPCEQL